MHGTLTGTATLYKSGVMAMESTPYSAKLVVKGCYSSAIERQLVYSTSSAEWAVLLSVGRGIFLILVPEMGKSF